MGHRTALLKDTLREVRKSLGRFISIFAIVGIGVAFFAGVKASVPVMKDTADNYYRDYNLMDIKIQSTMGLTQDDVKEIQNIEGIDGVYAGYSMDSLSIKNNRQSVVKVMSMPSNTSEDNQSYINQYRLMEGRMPENENECIMEADSISPSGYEIGDTIILESGSDDDIHDSLKNVAYTIVGKVETPNYLSYEKGSSTIGSGKVEHYIAVFDTNFTMDIYTEMYVTIDGAKDYNSYSDEYFDYIDPVVKQINDVASVQEVKRIDDVKKEAQEKIDDGWKEYQDNKAIFDTKIQDAKNQLAQAHQQMSSGQAELVTQYQNGLDEIAKNQATLQEKNEQLNDAQAQYDAGYAQLQQQEENFQQQLPQLQEQVRTLQKSLEDINQGIAGIDVQLQTPDLPEEQRFILQAQRDELANQRIEVQAGIQQLQSVIDDTPKQIADGKAQLATSAQQIVDGRAQISDGWTQLEKARPTLESSIASAQQQLNSGAQEIANNETTLANEEKDGQAKLDEAKEQLEKAQQDLSDLENPQWYVLDRNSHYSYRDYGSAADRMSGISKVFPLFFFLVSALVCLTTMTRMVDEQRQEIGTLKALGYTKFYIAMKYVAYAGIASVFGGIAGAIIGMTIFPTVIYNAWGIMYMMPSVHLEAQLPLAFTAIGLASVITVAAAIFACYKELMETPSLLMRPKAPKNGKKIFLEHMPFIWKHFSFIYKVTARNIFRYKKRFLMTVIGISGCTALLVAGFGIRDSISAIVTKQYNEIYAFDVSMTYKSDISKSESEQIITDVTEDERLQEYLEIAVYHGTFKHDDSDASVDMYVDLDNAKFPDFFNLHTRIGQKALTLNDNGVIITEKLSKLKDLDIGDTLAVDNGDGVMRDVVVEGICENYVGHSIYMSENYYKSVFKESAKTSGILAIMENDTEDNEASLGADFMKLDQIESVSFYSSLAATFQDTISSLLVVVIVLIISAGTLAFVVLYNLTNVNISERLREIATIKVLGFYDKEVSAYVYRENILLTFIGAGFGLLLGVLLHMMIMNMAEMDNIMFGRNIAFMSFVISLVITMVFAIIVNVVMYRKLKMIPMVESLKSIE